MPTMMDRYAIMRGKVSEAWSQSSSGYNSRTLSPSSPCAIRREQKRLRRPKSTPSHLRLSQKNDDLVEVNRPSSVPPGSNPDCDRVYQVEHEPVRKHNLENHLGVKRNKSPPWQKNMDTPAAAYNMGNGFTLYKSKEKMNMHVKMDTVLETPAVEVVAQQRRKSTLDPAIEALINQLQQQINDLQYFLEEERLNHRDTIRNAEQRIQQKVEEMLQQQENIVRQLEEDHERDMDRLREEQLKALEDQQEQADAQVAKMKSEIEFLQGAFESYKSTLHQEMTEEFNKRIETLKTDHDQQMEKQIKDLKQKMITERTAEKSAINKEHMKQVQLLERDHKKEIDSLTRRFASASADLEKLKSVEKEHAELKAQHKELMREHGRSADKLKIALLELQDAKLKIVEYEENFQDKIQQVDDKYQEQINNLMMQNTELRRVYMRKCEELVDEKEQNKTKVLQRATSAKDVMKTIINTRHRSNVSMAGGGPDADSEDGLPKDRPSSAPLTRTENKVALLSAGKTEPSIKLH